MRILLATEGESDEVVAQGLIRALCPDAQIEPKRFPARGFPTVRRLLPDTVRAAHFGFYEILVVHFDLDDTLPAGAPNLTASLRWQAIRSLVDSTTTTLRDCKRPAPLRTVLMTPLQSTEAWLCWGQEGGTGTDWESKDRHALKTRLYGQPPLGLIEKAQTYTESLLGQTQTNPSHPLSLSDFLKVLQEAVATG
jgi:hypothetical protein